MTPLIFAGVEAEYKNGPYVACKKINAAGDALGEMLKLTTLDSKIRSAEEVSAAARLPPSSMATVSAANQAEYDPIAETAISFGSVCSMR